MGKTKNKKEKKMSAMMLKLRLSFPNFLKTTFKTRIPNKATYTSHLFYEPALKKQKLTFPGLTKSK